MRARLLFSPRRYGDESAVIGETMLSSYLSEQPTNITARAHRDTLPDYPNLSDALAYGPTELTIPIPRLAKSAGVDAMGNTGNQFLVSAKFHVFSSTASFVLRNPLNATITITSLSAEALYHGDTLGTLHYEFPLVLASRTDTEDGRGETELTKIPVKWSLPASDILRRVIGGPLRVNATANATVTIDNFQDLHLNLSLQEIGAGVGF